MSINNTCLSESPVLKFRNKEHFIKRLARIFPILIISFALHLLILLVIALIPGEEKPMEEEKQVIIDIDDWVEDVDDPETKIVDLPDQPDSDFVAKIDLPDVKTDKDPVPPLEKIILDNHPPEDTPITPVISPVAINPNPTHEIPTIIGIKFPTIKNLESPKIFTQRSPKGIAQAVHQHSCKETLDPVQKALKWLEAHQEKNGSWDPVKHEGRPHKKSLPVVATACATLPFYGAGYHEKKGDYSEVIKKSITYINKEVYQHRKNPQFGSNYGAALILMALSESFIMANNLTSKRNAETVAKYLIDQYTAHPGQGWGYHSAGSDFSVTGWVILALKTAKLARLRALNTPEAKQAEIAYKTWLSQVTDDKTGMGSYRPGHKPSPNMTYVGMFVKQALNFKPEDPFLKQAAQNTTAWAKTGTTFKDNKPKNLYGVYYGTLAAFQTGGETWSVWNSVMKKSLVLSQRTGDVTKLGGSWDPTHDHTGEIGGRVYTTALLALTLEIYYRYSLMN
jgi:hypothetical protein